jgi:hypothetical protein
MVSPNIHCQFCRRKFKSERGRSLHLTKSEYCAHLIQKNYHDQPVVFSGSLSLLTPVTLTHEPDTKRKPVPLTPVPDGKRRKYSIISDTGSDSDAADNQNHIGGFFDDDVIEDDTNYQSKQTVGNHKDNPSTPSSKLNYELLNQDKIYSEQGYGGTISNPGEYYSSVELVHILQKCSAPLYLFDKIQNWVSRSISHHQV